MGDIFNGITFNTTNVFNGLKTIFNGFGVNITNIADKLFELLETVTFNTSTLSSGLGVILDELDITTFDILTFLLKVGNYLDLELTTDVFNEIAEILNGKSFSFSDIVKVFKDIQELNNITLKDILDAVGHVTNGFTFNMSSIFTKFLNPDYNASKIINAFKNIYESISFDKSKVIDTIIDVIESVKFNRTSLIDGLSEIFDISQLNTSSIKSGFDKIVPLINFKFSTFLMVCDLISSYGTFNSSLICDGLDKITVGLGANVSTVIGKIYSKIGYYVKFPYNFKEPGLYNITVKYFANDKYNSAVNDSAKLHIVPFENIKIKVNLEKLPKNYGDKTSGYLFLEDGYGEAISGVINLYLNGNKIGDIKTDKYGYAQFSIDNLASGSYVLQFEYNGTTEEVEFALNLPKIATNIVYSNMNTQTVNVNVDGKIGKYFSVVLKDVKGEVLRNKPIMIGYDGTTYSGYTDNDGVYKLQINIQKAGTYTISACYLGDNIYGPSYITAKITVAKQNAKLVVVKKKTFKAKTKKKILKATFKSAKGHPLKGKIIKFKVKKKIYSAKTNKKGVAKVKIKLAKKGKYKVLVNFAGDTMYNKISKKFTLRIK